MPLATTSSYFLLRIVLLHSSFMIGYLIKVEVCFFEEEDIIIGLALVANSILFLVPVLLQEELSDTPAVRLLGGIREEFNPGSIVSPIAGSRKGTAPANNMLDRPVARSKRSQEEGAPTRMI